MLWKMCLFCWSTGSILTAWLKPFRLSNPDKHVTHRDAMLDGNSSTLFAFQTDISKYCLALHYFLQLFSPYVLPLTIVWDNLRPYLEMKKIPVSQINYFRKTDISDVFTSHLIQTNKRNKYPLYSYSSEVEIYKLQTQIN